MHAYLFLLPSLTGVLVLFVIPYLDVLRRSFLDGTGQRFVGMDNYKTVVENISFRLAAGNTVKFAVVCIPPFDRHLPADLRWADSFRAEVRIFKVRVPAAHGDSGGDSGVVLAADL